MSEEKKRFEQWCIVEIMGHVRFAGLVTEETLFGTALCRIDVPETTTPDGTPRQAFTKLFGAAAIYGVTPVSEETARMAAQQIAAQPMHEWDVREAYKRLPLASEQPVSAGDPIEDFGYRDDEDGVPL